MTTSFDRTESGKWAIASAELVGKYEEGRDKALNDAASRGFAAADGSSLAAILAMGQETKSKLTEFNGTKIYDDRRGILFQQQEFEMKLIVSLAKLGMQLYAAELIFALSLEEAANTALRDQGTADVVRLNAEVDLRQRSIIQSRAEAERKVTVLKAALVDAEEGTLVYEAALINAQLATAEKKLEIIASIYEVLAAEELVLAAENRRAATLEVLLAAELVVADIKKAMIPFYIEKAGARVQLADAITKDIPVQKAIVELGYDKIDLENRKEFAAHLLRLAENELELAKLGWTRANSVLTLTQLQSRRLLQAYENTVQAEVLTLKKSLAEDGVDLRLSSSLARTGITVNDDAQVAYAEAGNTTTELQAIRSGLAHRAGSQANAIRSGLTRNTINDTTTLLSRKIVHGAF